MTGPDVPGAQFARLWTRLYTAWLPEPARSDRRDEIASDLHEEVATGLATGLPLRSVSKHVAARVIRGAFSDVLWRFETEAAGERMIGGRGVPVALAVVLVPTVLVWDAARARLAGSALAAGSTAVVRALAALLLAISVASAVRAAAGRGGRLGSRPDPIHLAVGFLACSFAAAVLWRDAPPPFDHVAAVAWGAFGIGLASSAVALPLSWWYRHSHRTRVAVRKISS